MKKFLFLPICFSMCGCFSESFHSSTVSDAGDFYESETTTISTTPGYYAPPAPVVNHHTHTTHVVSDPWASRENKRLQRQNNRLANQNNSLASRNNRLSYQNQHLANQNQRLVAQPVRYAPQRNTHNAPRYKAPRQNVRTNYSHNTPQYWNGEIDRQLRNGRGTVNLGGRNIDNRQMQALSSALKNRRNVHEVHLSGTNISQLPQDFGQGMNNLQKVHLRGTRVNNMPKNFWKNKRHLSQVSLPQSAPINNVPMQHRSKIQR